MTVEDIAAAENVSPAIVQKSLDAVREYRYRFSNE